LLFGCNHYTVIITAAVFLLAVGCYIIIIFLP